MGRHPDLGANTKTFNLASVPGSNHRCRSDCLAPQHSANWSHTLPPFRALIHNNMTLTERWVCVHYRMDYILCFHFSCVALCTEHSLYASIIGVFSSRIVYLYEAILRDT